MGHLSITTHKGFEFWTWEATYYSETKNSPYQIANVTFSLELLDHILFFPHYKKYVEILNVTTYS